MFDSLQSLGIENLIPFALLILVFVTRSRYHRELLRLDPILRHRLYESFGRFRLIQFAVIAVSVLPVVASGLSRPGEVRLAPGEKTIQELILSSLPFLISVSGLSVWFTVGYARMRAKLVELQMPDNFVRTYLADRPIMALTLGTLLFLAWRQHL